jgi:XRE family transcriptional regulator, fatty acid utilization regulator
VGARLQALRKARGLTAQQVGERVGMAQQNLSRIEQGRHAVSFPTLEKILAAMGYTLADILPDEPISSPPTP